jgi:hypothetical protein
MAESLLYPDDGFCFLAVGNAITLLILPPYLADSLPDQVYAFHGIAIEGAEYPTKVIGIIHIDIIKQDQVWSGEQPRTYRPAEKSE